MKAKENYCELIPVFFLLKYFSLISDCLDDYSTYALIFSLLHSVHILRILALRYRSGGIFVFCSNSGLLFLEGSVVQFPPLFGEEGISFCFDSQFTQRSSWY